MSTGCVDTNCSDMVFKLVLSAHAVTSPEHGTASTLANDPCLPGAPAQKIDIASQGDVVFHKPVKGSSVDVTPPGKFGGKVRNGGS